MNTYRLGSHLWTALVVLLPVFCSTQFASAQQTVDTDKRSAEETSLLNTARNLHNRSRHHYDYGRYAEAIADIGQAKKIIEEVEGPDSSLVTTFINDTAYYYIAKGELGPVDALFAEVVERTKKATGEDSLEVANAELRLADFLRGRGLFQDSEDLYARILARLERSPDDRKALEQMPRVLRNLGVAHADRGAIDEAEELLLRALAISEEIAGKGHVSTGNSINELALFYSVHAGRHEEAEELFKKLLAIIEPHFGPSGQVWAAQENLGMAYLRSGKHADAEALLKDRYEFERGDPFLEEMGSPKLAHSASRLGELYWAMGNMEFALPLWNEAGERYARHENATLAIGSEQERLVYAAGLVKNLNATISMHLYGAAESPLAAEMALKRILRTKGRVVEAQADTYRALREGLEVFDKEQIQRLSVLRGSLAYWANSGGGTDRVAEAEAELAGIERDLATKSAALVDINAVLQLDELRKVLPRDAALVEFVRFQPFDIATRTHREPHYAAYVLTRDGAPFGVDLGTAASLEASVDGLRDALGSRGALEVRSKSLYSSLVKPWLSNLDKEQHLILAPDGLLNLLPFEVLTAPSGQSLLESHTLTYLNCGRQLSAVGGGSFGSKASVVIGDPDYASQLDEKAAQTSDQKPRQQWERLPGTAEEARVVHGLLDGSTLLTGEEAEEQALKEVDSPRILHIATHGYFHGASGTNAPEEARGIVVVGTGTKHRMQTSWQAQGNPLLRSGLVMAGANSWRQDMEDGELSALEATGLDLLGTQLVVMSACETGVGEVTSGQGVFGLRRAMELAGAESQVMSLWQVSDAATIELMKQFYTALMGGKSRAAALRDARLALSKSEEWSHPYFWGAFILSGDWRALR